MGKIVSIIVALLLVGGIAASAALLLGKMMNDYEVTSNDTWGNDTMNETYNYLDEIYDAVEEYQAKLEGGSFLEDIPIVGLVITSGYTIVFSAQVMTDIAPLLIDAAFNAIGIDPGTGKTISAIFSIIVIFAIIKFATGRED